MMRKDPHEPKTICLVWGLFGMRLGPFGDGFGTGGLIPISSPILNFSVAFAISFRWKGGVRGIGKCA